MSFLEGAAQFRDNCWANPCVPTTLAICIGASAFTVVKGVSLLLVAVATIDKVVAAAVILGAVYTLSTSVCLIKWLLIDPDAAECEQMRNMGRCSLVLNTLYAVIVTVAFGTGDNGED